jgi:hypothetical protein
MRPRRCWQTCRLTLCRRWGIFAAEPLLVDKFVPESETFVVIASKPMKVILLAFQITE